MWSSSIFTDQKGFAGICAPVLFSLVTVIPTSMPYDKKHCTTPSEANVSQHIDLYKVSKLKAYFIQQPGISPSLTKLHSMGKHFTLDQVCIVTGGNSGVSIYIYFLIINHSRYA